MEIRPVESDDGVSGFGICLHLNKAEASGETRRPVGHDLEPLNRAVLFKSLLSKLAG